MSSAGQMMQERRERERDRARGSTPPAQQPASLPGSGVRGTEKTGQPSRRVAATMPHVFSALPSIYRAVIMREREVCLS